MAVTWIQVRDILDEALQIPPEDRSRYLDKACPQPEFRRYVDSLILSYEKADEFLEQPALDQHAETWGEAESLPLWVGRRIGPYLIEKEIGQGGMGTVFQAVRADDEYQKQVAIKLVRGGFGSSSAIARFKAERQILAGLEHPNIARLLDGGRTEEGYPYLVMELVDGMPIDEYCDAHRLTIDQRLQLFRAACDAVQFAHQNLIIHRDLKPGNILVTREGVPKLLDFGIAKLLSPDSLSPTPEPTVGFMRMLTPAYASPEQVRGEPVNTATDVYSLGVVLYMLLTGHRPYQVTGCSPQALADIICHTAPEKPSEIVVRTEIIGGPSGDGTQTVTPESVSSARDAKPDKLRRRLSGDLDNIALTALRKDPQRRYSSVEQFSDDVRRHLKGLPVRAREDTLAYRSGKFVKRHKLVVATVTIFVLTLLGGIAATMRQARIARAERAKAERRFNDVRKLANSLTIEIDDAVANVPGAVAARKIIVSTGLKYLDSLASEAGRDPDLQSELADDYQIIGDIQGRQGIENLGDSAGAIASYQKAAHINETLLKENPGYARAQTDLGLLYVDIAEVLSATGQNSSALQYARKAKDLLADLATRNPSDLRAQSHLGVAYGTLGRLQDFSGDYQESLDSSSKATALYQRVAGSSDKTRAHIGQYNLGVTALWTEEVRQHVGDYKKAQQSGEQALQILGAVLARNSKNVRAQLDVCESYIAFGDTLRKQGEAQKAVTNYQAARALAETAATADPNDQRAQEDTTGVYYRLGEVFLARGDITHALNYGQKALLIGTRMSAIDPMNMDTKLQLANTYHLLGEAYEARARKAAGAGHLRSSYLSEALSSYRKSFGAYTSLQQSGGLPQYEVANLHLVADEMKRCDALVARLGTVSSN